MNCYNSQTYLQEAIDSIITQTYSDWELLFWDNQSTDNSAEIVQSYNDPRIKYYYAPEHTPLGKARNLVLKKITGNFVAFLDCDDIWLPKKLQLQLDLMQRSNLKMCYGGVIYIDENSEEKSRFLPDAHTGNVFRQLLKRYEVNMQSVMLRNDFDIHFDDTMQFSPDFDLFMKTAARYPVGVIHDYLVKYRELSDSLTSKKIDRWGIEYEQTLNDIFTAQPELSSRYPTEYQLAYAKVAYYKARYSISRGNMHEARELLAPYRSASLTYALLYALTFFPATLWHFIHKLKQAAR